MGDKQKSGNDGPAAHRVRKWTGIILSIAAGLSSMTVLFQQTCAQLNEAKREARAAEQSTAAGYRTLVGAVGELQSILQDTQTRADETDDDLHQLRQDMASMRQDLSYCRAYIDFDSRGRFAYEQPAPTPVMSVPRERRHVSKPRAPLPKSVKKAKVFQDVRQQQDCSPEDPLCGASALE